jgi:Glycosyl transferases group 1/DUF based on E. rectale Gene description (DUF3880)
MTSFRDARVWLDYVAYPVTTAVYFQRALRRICRTVTVGPRLPHEYIQQWQLQEMNLPLYDQDIPTGFSPDISRIVAAVSPDQRPDLYLWVESVPGHYPANLAALSCPKACYLIDSHLNLSLHLEWASGFDHVFIAQREYLPAFRRRGHNVHWLPLGCDPEIHRRHDVTPLHQIGFVGSVREGSRRERLLRRLSQTFALEYKRCFWDEMARHFSASRLVFNDALKNDLNMRLFEAMSCGSLLLTDLAKNSGQDALFRDGEEYALYRDGSMVDVARFYLENEELRRQVAARGQRLVHNAHTYLHRVEDLLEVVLGGKGETFSPELLRERSLEGVPPLDGDSSGGAFHSRAGRSFVIPVLDMSPASRYNIVTLLEDLKDIAGDVIVIFNGREVADRLKDHPRITNYAVMKQNIGVARAWNLGLEMAATPTVFILNADLHVTPAAIHAVEEGLWELPQAACAGPQGSFFDFTLARDHVYFDRGDCSSPLAVDAVSGFFFAVKLQHFNDKLIRFENGFTPCYFEEWDLGLQIRQAGLKSYVVPTTEYDHVWSGSLRALREVCYYGVSEAPDAILLRNRRSFLNKWRSIAARENNPDLLGSGFKAYSVGRGAEIVSNV